MIIENVAYTPMVIQCGSTGALKGVWFATVEAVQAMLQKETVHYWSFHRQEVKELPAFSIQHIDRSCDGAVLLVTLHWAVENYCLRSRSIKSCFCSQRDRPGRAWDGLPIACVFMDEQMRILHLSFQRYRAIDKTAETKVLHLDSADGVDLLETQTRIASVRLSCGHDVCQIVVDLPAGEPFCRTGNRSCFSPWWRREPKEKNRG